MEDKIRTLEGVTDCSITFATKQLRVSASDALSLLPDMQKICASIEPDVVVVAPAPKGQGVQAGQTIFTLQNLGCAHCASKMEDKIRTLEGVTDCSITFATKQLRVSASDALSLLPDMQKICASIEPDVVVVAPASNKTGAQPAMGEASAAQKKELKQVIVGAVLFAAGMLMSDHLPLPEVMQVPWLSAILLLIAYLLLGKDVLRTAAKNLTRGHMLDENFLMSIATIGAIILGEYGEAVGVMLFFRVGTYCEDLAVNKTRTQITEAVDLRPQTIVVLDAHGNQTETPAEEVPVGALIQVLVGDRVPLDGVIVTGESRLDTAAITGESIPVSARVGDAVQSGSINLAGVLTVRVTHVLDESMVSRILHAVEDAAAGKPKIERLLTRFAHVYTPTVVAIAVFTAIVPSLVTGNWSYWVHTALTFLVISCPCALVLSVPLAFFSGIGAGSKRGILFKSGASLEALHNIKCVAMDKTGTLTHGNFVVQEIEAVSPLTVDALLALAASCEAHSSHPIAVSIVASAKEKKLSLHTVHDLQEVAGMGMQATFQDCTVLCGNTKLMAANNVTLPAMQAATGAVVHVAMGGNYYGSIHIADTIKAEANAAVTALRKRGLTTAMLTGDNEQTAQLTAQSIGIDAVRASLLPTDKVQGLHDLREKHGAVLYIGDGINDAPVLAGADVGAAMGSGADAAIEVADVVFMTPDLHAVDAAMDIAKRTHAIVIQNISVALGVKILVMILGLAGIYSSMWLAIFADTGVALLCVLNAMRVLYLKR